MLAREDLLWCPCTKVTQQALSERFLTFPAAIFERVFKDLLPQLEDNWRQRNKRPLPDSIKFALKHFERIWVVDGESSAYGEKPAVGTGEPEGFAVVTIASCRTNAAECYS